MDIILLLLWIVLGAIPFYVIIESHMSMKLRFFAHFAYLFFYLYIVYTIGNILQ